MEQLAHPPPGHRHHLRRAGRHRPGNLHPRGLGHAHEVNCVLLGDAAFLALTASLIDPDIRLAALSLQAVRNGGLPISARPPGRDRRAYRRNVVPGVLDKENGRAVLATLDAAVEGVAGRLVRRHGHGAAAKSTINDAGVAFSGHTEYLAEKTGTPQVVMMLAGEPGHGEPTLRVALATTHLPLKDVSAAITRTAWPHPRHHQPIATEIRHRRAAHPGDRPEPARGRERLPGPRGNRCHHPGDRRGAGARHRCARPVSGRHLFQPKYLRTPTACWPCTTTRACRY
jgi:hypothetical protein